MWLLQIKEVLDQFPVWKEYKDQKHDLFLNDRPVSGYLTGTDCLVVSGRSSDILPLVVLVVQRIDVGLVIERSLVRLLPAGALSSQLGQLSLPSLRGR